MGKYPFINFGLDCSVSAFNLFFGILFLIMLYLGCWMVVAVAKGMTIGFLSLLMFSILFCAFVTHIVFDVIFKKSKGFDAKDVKFGESSKKRSFQGPGRSSGPQDPLGIDSDASLRAE